MDQFKVVYRCKTCNGYVHEDDLRYGPEVGVWVHQTFISKQWCGPVVSIGRHRVTSSGQVMEKVRNG